MRYESRYERDYLERTIETVRNHRDAENCWPQWANIFADEIERLWKIEELARAVMEPFTGSYCCGCCPYSTSFLVSQGDCDCGCHVTARNIVALKEALAGQAPGDVARRMAEISPRYLRGASQ